jgi:hypothetical protein
LVVIAILGGRPRLHRPFSWCACPAAMFGMRAGFRPSNVDLCSVQSQGSLRLLWCTMVFFGPCVATHVAIASYSQHISRLLLFLIIQGFSVLA